jgi:hypothetical protein
LIPVSHSILQYPKGFNQTSLKHFVFPVSLSSQLEGTQSTVAIPANVGRSKILLVDTPGFDDSERPDSEILADISRALTAQHKLGIPLKGVIYVHRITDTRYQGNSVKTLKMFKEICGKDALKNVILVTTRWHEIADAQLGAQREQQLRTKFWSYMLGHGSTMARFYGDTESAHVIASQLMVKSSVVLDLQRELAEEGKTLMQTKAGALVNDNLEDLKAQARKELQDLEELKENLVRQDRAMRLQWEQDLARERESLHRAGQAQVSLDRNIGNEVREGIQRAAKRKSGMHTMLRIVPTVLEIFGLFVPFGGGLSTLVTWMQDPSSISDTLADFLGSF